MTFSEQLKADIALIEPALEKYLSRETGAVTHVLVDNPMEGYGISMEKMLAAS